MINKFFFNPPTDQWPEIIRRPQMNNAELKNIVSDILQQVKQNGDKALKNYCLQFDGISLSNLKVSEAEIKEASLLVDENLKNAIRIAKENIEIFHLSQKEISNQIQTSKGVWCWRKSVAIEKVGLYIPGGSAPLFSSLLMLAIPALIAGCNEIVVCTPAGKDGKINPAILFVADLLGLKNIYKIGGAQAIAAMAYGTETISKVYKVFGPGNQFVTCAKQIVNAGDIAIDMPAGPSEVAVYADETCNPAFVAADLLSQAEHGPDSQVMLIASTLSIAENVRNEIEFQLNYLSRSETAKLTLTNSRFIVLQNVDEAFNLLNEYAPEHLIIACDDAENLSQKVINAGSVFLGHYSAESAGDYASGTNHTLPTNGFAKAYSGISLDSFVKKITFQKLSKEGLKNIGTAVEIMADAERLTAHKNAISIRLKNL